LRLDKKRAFLKLGLFFVGSKFENTIWPQIEKKISNPTEATAWRDQVVCGSILRSEAAFFL
jgi:hypothetical protein